MSFRLLHFALCFLLSTPVLGVDTIKVVHPDPVTEAWRWTHFDRASGLAGVPTEIFEDRDGYIWIATNEGVQRYDGWTFETFTKEDGLGSNLTGSIAQTRDGAMWFGTGAGISRFDPSTQLPSTTLRAGGPAWKTYTTEDSLASNDALTRGNNLFEARDGTLWAGFSGTGDVSRKRSSEEVWETITTPLSDSTTAITRITQTRDGDLWFAAWRHGVLRLEPSSGSWRHYSSRDGLHQSWLTEVFQRPDGIVFAAGRGGISRFDPSASSEGGGALVARRDGG